MLARATDHSPGAPDAAPIDLDRAVVLMAHIVLTHGEVYAPILLRLMREKEERDRNNPLALAAQIMQNYTRDGGLKAIR